jgi:hypothetical protein
MFECGFLPVRARSPRLSDEALNTRFHEHFRPGGLEPRISVRAENGDAEGENYFKLDTSLSDKCER